MKSFYLDWAATAPPDSDVVEEINDTTGKYIGNPSSLHFEGKKAKSKMDSIKASIADLLGCPAGSLYFTASGSEANAIILLSTLMYRKKGHILISEIEHPSVFEYPVVLQQLGHTVEIIPSNTGGFITPEAVSTKLRPDTRMVCIMAVNNETGAVQPIKEIAALLKEYSENRPETAGPILLHSDGVQALGKVHLPLDYVDSAAFSGHKIGTPKGIGLLYIKEAAKQEIEPLFRGGGQEAGMRPGTENIPAMAGFLKALQKRMRAAPVMDTAEEPLWELSNSVMNEIKSIPGVWTLPKERTPYDQRYSPFIMMLRTPLPGEVVVRIMSDKGFAVSTGSACSSSRSNTNRAAASLGLKGKDAMKVIRISFGWTTKKSDIDQFCRTLREELAAWQA